MPLDAAVEVRVLVSPLAVDAEGPPVEDVVTETVDVGVSLGCVGIVFADVARVASPGAGAVRRLE